MPDFSPSRFRIRASLSRLGILAAGTLLSSFLAAPQADAQMVRLPDLRRQLPFLPHADWFVPVTPARPIYKILARIKPGTDPAQIIQSVNASLSLDPNAGRKKFIIAPLLRYVKASRLPGLHVLAVSDPAKLAQTIAALAANPNVVYAQPDHHAHLLLKKQGTSLPRPNDSYWGKEDLEHLIVVIAGLDTPDSARDDDSSSWTYTWSLETVNALAAWQVYPGSYHTATVRRQLLSSDPGRLPRVGVIDTGIDMTHPDFSYTGNPSHGMNDTNVANGGQLVPSLARSFAEGNDDPNPLLAMDDFGHGTSVAGVIGASPNNRAGIPGLGFPAQIVPIKVTDLDGNADESEIVDSVIYAVDSKCLVINMSLALDTTDFPQALQDSADYAWNNGSLIVAAAGNDGNPTIPLLAQTRRYPASLVHVLAVAASAFGGDGTVAGEQLASYSNNGYSLGITAPGGDVTTFNNTSPNGADFGLDPIQEYVLIWTLAPTYQVRLSDPDDPEGAYAALGLYGLNYGAVPGTSFACPHVVGLAALYAAANNITPATPQGPQLIVNAIERGAVQMNSRRDGGFDTTFGWGRIDAYNTVKNLNARNATVGGGIGQITVKGTVMHNVQVTATLADGSSTKKYYATSAPDGIFHLVNMPAGTYKLKCSAFGYTKQIYATIVAGCDQMGMNLAL